MIPESNHFVVYPPDPCEIAASVSEMVYRSVGTALDPIISVASYSQRFTVKEPDR